MIPQVIVIRVCYYGISDSLGACCLVFPWFCSYTVTCVFEVVWFLCFSFFSNYLSSFSKGKIKLYEC